MFSNHRILLKRSLTGLLFVSVLLGSIIWSPFSCAFLFFFTTVVGLNEFYQLAEKSGVKIQKIVGILTGVVVYMAVFMLAGNKVELYHLLALAFLPVFLLFIIELYRGNENPFANISFTLAGILYIALPFSLLNFLSLYPAFDLGKPYQPELLLGYFFILWTNDTMAYVTGSLLGKHRLFERISPKKTWEGSIGGGLFGLLVAWILSFYFDATGLADWLVIAGMVVVFGTFGDLVESMLKRSIGVKDSGSILPGHGGVLDRFDGVFISAPVVVAYIIFVH